MLVVIPHVGDVDDFAGDLATFAGLRSRSCPAWERPPGEARPGDEILARRLRVARRLLDDHPPRLVVTSMQAAMQPVPTPAALARASRTIRVGETIAVEELITWLADRGMTRVEVVEVAGEFSLRGGILDVFPPTAPSPSASSSSATTSSRSAPSTPRPQRSLGALDSVDRSPPPRPPPTSRPTPSATWPTTCREGLGRPGRARRPPRAGRPLPRPRRDRRGLFTVEAHLQPPDRAAVDHPLGRRLGQPGDDLPLPGRERRALLRRAGEGQGRT